MNILKPLKTKISTQLLSWYKEEKREMPWRKTKDPYAIWVSEIMLQQTQVDTVIPYFNRWMHTFPTIKKLAQAKDEKVLKMWEGLGYYSRARNLQKAAQMVAKEHGGKLPKDSAQLSSLPGIGPYSLGAISSIAFELPIAAVDGNVLRVVSRLFEIHKNIKDKKTVDEVREIVTALFSDKDRGDMTQAWMELGATVCLPTNPKCLICPLQKLCAAKKKNLTDKLPIVSKRPKTKKVVTAAIILKRENTFLLEKRPLGKIMGGLWLFPTVELPGPVNKHKQEISALFEKEFGIKVKPANQLLTLSHSYTVHRAQLNVFLAQGTTPKKLHPDLNWINESRLKETPFPAVHAKIIDQILN